MLIGRQCLRQLLNHLRQLFWLKPNQPPRHFCSHHSRKFRELQGQFIVHLGERRIDVGEQPDKPIGAGLSLTQTFSLAVSAARGEPFVISGLLDGFNGDQKSLTALT